MSDYYHFTLDFILRRDAPAALHAAFAKLAGREIPTRDEMADLPEIVADYLAAPFQPQGLDGDGFTYRYSRSGMQFRAEKPEDGTHWIHMERTFHDDEYFNGGMYYPFWLMQFAAGQGYLGNYTFGSSELPTLLYKDGDEIIEIDMSINPSDKWGIRPHGTPVDQENSARVRETRRINIQELLDGLGGTFDYE